MHWPPTSYLEGFILPSPWIPLCCDTYTNPTHLPPWRLVLLPKSSLISSVVSLPQAFCHPATHMYVYVFFFLSPPIPLWTDIVFPSCEWCSPTQHISLLGKLHPPTLESFLSHPGMYWHSSKTSYNYFLLDMNFLGSIMSADSNPISSPVYDLNDPLGRELCKKYRACRIKRKLILTL